MGEALRRALELRQNGELGRAMSLLTGWLEQRVPASDTHLTVTEVQAIEQIADLASLNGNYSAADACLAAIIGSCVQTGDLYAADYAALGRTRLALSAGNLDRAQAELLSPARAFSWALDEVAVDDLAAWQDAIEWPDTDHSDRALLLTLLDLTAAEYFCVRGAYARAVAFAGMGQRQAEEHTGTAKRYIVLLLLVEIKSLLDCGELVEASDRLARADALIRESRQRSLRIGWLELEARRAYLAGELGKACDLYDEVVKQCENAGFTHAQLRAELNLANTLIVVNRTVDAEAIVLDVLERSMNGGAHSVSERAFYLLQLIQLRRISTADEVAMVVHRRRSPVIRSSQLAATSLTLRPPTIDFLSQFEADSLRFHYLIGQRNIEAATELVDTLRDEYGSTDSRLIRSRLFVLLGILSSRKQELDHAQLDLSEAAIDLEALGLVTDLREVKVYQQRCARQRNHDDEVESFTRELDALTSTLEASLGQPHRALYMLNKWSAGEEALLHELGVLTRLRTQAGSAPWWRRGFARWTIQRGIHRLLERLESQQAASRAELLAREAEPRRAPSFWTRLSACNPAEAVITYTVLPDRLCVIVEQRYKLSFAVSSITRLALRDLTRRWHECAMELGGGSQRGLKRVSLQELKQAKLDEFLELNQQLSAALKLDDIARVLRPGVKALRIVPDDVLHGYAFAMARISSPNFKGALSEHFDIHIGFDAVASQPAAAPLASAFVGGVTQAWTGYEALAHARDEAIHIAKVLMEQGLPEASISCQAGAVSKQDLLASLSSKELVHIACHGRFAIDALEETGLLLVSGDGTEELVSLRDLLRSEALRCRHVTLSSCWSADSYTLPGRRIFSLPEALCRSGVRCVLGCLWPVHDAFAQRFMTRFYELAAHMTTDRALRAVQAECRARAGGLATQELDSAEPALWGGFAVYGEPTKLAFRGAIAVAAPHRS